MTRLSELSLSKQAMDQFARPSPIRPIMKMGEPQNIRTMGLDPADVISFGGGWVNHPAPEPLRQAYCEIAADPTAFHCEKAREGIGRFGKWSGDRSPGR